MLKSPQLSISLQKWLQSSAVYVFRFGSDGTDNLLVSTSCDLYAVEDNLITILQVSSPSHLNPHWFTSVTGTALRVSHYHRGRTRTSASGPSRWNSKLNFDWNGGAGSCEWHVHWNGIEKVTVYCDFTAVVRNICNYRSTRCRFTHGRSAFAFLFSYIYIYTHSSRCICSLFRNPFLRHWPSFLAHWLTSQRTHIHWDLLYFNRTRMFLLGVLALFPSLPARE